VDQVDLQMVVAELETTNLASTAQEFIPGLPGHTADVKITKWDKTVDDVFGADAITPALRTAIITFKDLSGDTITYTWTTNAFVTGYNISAAATGKVDGSPKLRLSGTPTRVAT
jgi:hypothetical protein